SLLKMDKEMMKMSLEEFEKLLVLFNEKYRKQSSVLSRRNFDSYSDEEIHAELSYSIALVGSALLGTVYDQSFAGFVKGAYRMTTGYIGVREGLNILKTRKIWSHPRVKEHYEALLKFFLGLFEIVIACMPAKLSQILNFIGFSGRFEKGIDYLESAFTIKNTFGSIASGVILGFIYLFLEYFYGLGRSKLDMMRKIEADFSAMFPDIAPTAAVRASICYLQADFDKSIVICDEILAVQHPKYIQYIFSWIKSWCYAYQYKWRDAALAMHSLLECKWSPAMFYYIYASFLFMDANGSNEKSYDAELREIFSKIPTLRLKIGGHKVFHDNFFVDRSQNYFTDSNHYFLPAYELFYIWNYFEIVLKLEKNVEKILEDLKSRLATVENDCTRFDEYAQLLFLKAVVLKHINREIEAEALFKEILKNSKKVKKDKFLLAHSAFEIGRIHAKNRRYLEAKSWIMKSKKNYSGYLTECLLDFRVERMLHQIKTEESESESFVKDQNAENSN
ncbi:Tetratricopeptide repeat protein 39B-like protein, partial [Dinothrombium tinctorium]